MEMPGGFLIAKDCDTTTDGGHARVLFALDLLKEMAEDLQYLENYRREESDGSYVCESLKKFKEWK